MSILYQIDGVKSPAIKKREVSRWIKAVATSYGKQVGDIAYMFCNDEKILEVNKQYLNHDYYTDIITFESGDGNNISGDIFISLDTVKSNSIEFNTNYINELHRVIIHGVLHLCGVNDKSPKERRNMTECENKALDILRDKSLYPTSLI